MNDFVSHKYDHEIKSLKSIIFDFRSHDQSFNLLYQNCQILYKLLISWKIILLISWSFFRSPEKNDFWSHDHLPIAPKITLPMLACLKVLGDNGRLKWVGRRFFEKFLFRFWGKNYRSGKKFSNPRLMYEQTEPIFQYLAEPTNISA